MLYQHMRTLGIEHFYIELVEEYPCENRDQLAMREGHYMRLMGTLNQLRPGAFAEAGGKNEYEKQYKKRWYEINKEHDNQRSKQWYEANKESIKELRSTPTTCEICGSTVTRPHIARHKKSQKCQAAARLAP